MRQARRDIFRNTTMAIIIITALLASHSIILLTDSTAPIVKPIDVFAEAYDSVNSTAAQVYISDKSDDNDDGGDSDEADSRKDSNNEEKKTGWSDIEYLSDANNNRMVDYKNLFGLNIGKVYNPNFVDNADWFLDSSNYEDHGDYYLIRYNYNWHFYSKISAPWYGCEAQSKAMLVTAKKYNETGESKYLEFSTKVFNGLNSPVLNHDGWLLGVAMENNHGKILNSQLFCVANLMTYYEYTGDERALKLFKKGVDVLEKNIDDLSTDCGTYYTMSKDRLVSHQKHPEYIKMLERLYLMTESNTLKNTLDDWQYDYLFPCYS
ncbi:MAG: D-glucuronyl C5-epimerase family protein [Nitrososphaeraceae archaeon]|nr:D-glucuronyl C5-epimerase family protein [Nitrososphaeraceae archaeon]